MGIGGVLDVCLCLGHGGISSNVRTVFIVDIIHNYIYIYSRMEGNYLWIKKVILRENTYF